MRTHVDLFSGIGGFSLAARWAGVETIAFAEIDPYASRVLEKHWPNVRNYGDIRNVPELSAWLVTGGVPCQPASVAGKRRGAADDGWLWPEALAAVERIRPAWVLFENPTGILSLDDGVEFERICAALEGQGYEVQPLAVPACAVGAPHRRDRVWIIANAQCQRWRWRGNTSGNRHAEEIAVLREGVAYANQQGPQGRNGEGLRECAGEQPIRESGSLMAHAARECINGQGVAGPERWPEPTNGGRWNTEPNVGRVAHGIPKRVDRLRCLGNSIVPQVAYAIIKRMIEAEEEC